MGSADQQAKLYKTFRFRVKDSTSGKRLAALARSVNQVWNYCNGAQRHALTHNTRWPSYGDLHALTRGSSKLIGLPSQIVQAVCREYVTRRKASGKAKLRWRVSSGPRRSLGWVPFTNQDLALDGDVACLRGVRLRIWKHRDIAGVIKSGSFAEDARGRWYLNVVCEFERPQSTNRTEIRAYDLGHTRAATGAVIGGDGTVGSHVLPQATFYRDLEPALAEAQRKGRKRQVRTINAKIRNRRLDAIHKFTRAAVDAAGAIFIGDISSTWQIAAGRGKATLDASWATLRNQFIYKGDHAGVPVAVVDERFTTQDCSACHARSGPKGRDGLAVRQWVCGECETVHDRDVNAALNIARLGCEALGLKGPGSLAL